VASAGPAGAKGKAGAVRGAERQKGAGQAHATSSEELENTALLFSWSMAELKALLE
jgi:hypothetical protein